MRTRDIPFAIVVLFAASCSVKTPPSTPELVEEALPETTEIPLDFEGAAAAATQRLEQRVDLHLAIGGSFDAPLSDP